MNNQKDTQKKGLNSYGHNNVLDIQMFSGKLNYEFAFKKTEKIVTALYMVTDCMEAGDAIKDRLRHLGVELLSDIFKLVSVNPLDKNKQITSSINRIQEVLSFVEIADNLGYISGMNTTILRKEFILLISELEIHQNKDKQYTFNLDEQMFSIPKLPEFNNKNIYSNTNQKDIKDKRTSYNNMSFMNTKNYSTNIATPKINYNQNNNHTHSPDEKINRIKMILSIIKDKELSIKDIAISFDNFSEKTIQRDLNDLVTKGQVKKTGNKRWSKYIAIKI